MILPGKHLCQRRSLIGVGSRILDLLQRPESVGSIWGRFNAAERSEAGSMSVTYDYFILALDFLYAIGCVELHDGRLDRVAQ